MNEQIPTEETKICKYCMNDHRTNGIMEKQHSFSGVISWVCGCGYRCCD